MIKMSYTVHRTLFQFFHLYVSLLQLIPKLVFAP